MGFLADGTPLKWEDSVQFVEYVKEHGVIQFLNVYAACKDRENDVFLWGDEVESLLLHVDRAAGHATLCLRGDVILKELHETISHISGGGTHVFHANFIPEYARYMIEATPGRPYGGTTADLRMVEVNMRMRRKMIEELLHEDEIILTVSNFPTMGAGGVFTTPHYEPRGPVALSRYLPDELISPHPRFATLTKNIRTRRGSRVEIRLPLFQDTHTTEAMQKELEVLPELQDPPPVWYDPRESIFMDAMGFGMGACCLQVTFQARSIREARHLYDHLAVLSPIILALTAATPFARGKLSDTDVRWTIISQAVDDRTPVERGIEDPEETAAAAAAAPGSAPAGTSTATPQRYINKSRYDSIDSYISLEDDFLPEYNDLDLIYDEATYKQLLESGIDELLARHVAHLFIRDPLVIYKEYVEIDDAEHSDHFENIQSTNWQTVRFKPPSPGAKTGWRVEFRTMEVQLTDFENAAFTVFVALLSRAILFFDLNLYIPITKVDENVKKAHHRDAVIQEQFFFRKNIQRCSSPSNTNNIPLTEDYYEPMTMAEIMCGKGPDFPGLIPVVRSYLEVIKCDKKTHDVVDPYLDLIARRSTGELMTTAAWHRRFVDLHPDYKHDSIISPQICYDWALTCHGIEQGTIEAPQLLGEYQHMESHVTALLNPSSEDEATLLSPDFERLDMQGGCEAVREFLTRHIRNASAGGAADADTDANANANAAADS